MNAFQTGSDYSDLPDHVRRIIERDGEIEFTPPSFERWLGRLQMLRTLAAMGAFVMVWLVTYSNTSNWEDATIRGIIAAIVFHFLAWAAGLFIFGEMYDHEVKSARSELEHKERERARRIETYYRERLRAQDASGRDEPGGVPPEAPAPVLQDDPLSHAIPGYVPTDATIANIAA